jgi:hypothetical protein
MQESSRISLIPDLNDRLRLGLVHAPLPNHVYRLSVHLTTIYMSPGSD